MASRNFNRAQCLEKEVKTLFAEVAIGATGAPTLTSGLGVTSIARTAAGDYTVTLDDKYTRFMWGNVVLLESGDEDIQVQFAAQDVSSAKTVSFICTAGATPADPSDGSKLYIRLDLKNTTAGE